MYFPQISEDQKKIQTIENAVMRKSRIMVAYNFPIVLHFYPWYLQSTMKPPCAIWVFPTSLQTYVSDSQRTERLFHLRFSNQMRKKKSPGYVGALGCTVARLAGLVLTALLSRSVMKGASIWMSAARRRGACLCHNLICIHFPRLRWKT